MQPSLISITKDYINLASNVLVMGLTPGSTDEMRSSLITLEHAYANTLAANHGLMEALWPSYYDLDDLWADPVAFFIDLLEWPSKCLVEEYSYLIN